MDKNKSVHILNHVFYTLIQLTWGLPQNLLAVILFIYLLIKDRHRPIFYYHGAVVTAWEKRSSMGLGMFIFFGHGNEDPEYAKAILVHEYGHTIQSCILGPLFLPVIGIPSLVWASTPVFVQRRREGRYTYFDFYPEAWANHEGERVLHRQAPHIRRADQKQ